MDIALLIAVWLHTVAFVIAWGYYGVLGRIVLPGLERSLEATARGGALLAIERRALPLVIVSMLIFAATGTYLLFVNQSYDGLGNFFVNTWTTLMLVKHLVVVMLIAAGVAVDILVRRAAEAKDEEARASALRMVGLTAEAATGLGAIIVLLTVAAQLAT